MEMHQIRYFLALSETLNFTRAAQRCNVSQPALTRAIQMLEEELGGLLLRRERSLTHLTDFGRLMEPQLRQIMADAESAKSTARSFLKLDNAAIKLGVMCTIGPIRFAGFLGAFRHANPGIDVTIVEGVPARLSERLLKGEIDLAVMAQPEDFDERLEVRPLYPERFMVALPKGHRLEEKNAIQLPELEGESYLLRINCEYKDQIGDLCRARGFSTHRVFASEREDWIQSMIAAGLGVCFLPEYSTTCPGVVTRPVVEPEIIRDVSLAYIAGRRFSPAMTAFIGALKGYGWERVVITE